MNLSQRCPACGFDPRPPTPVPSALLALPLKQARRAFERAFFVRLACEEGGSISGMVRRLGKDPHPDCGDRGSLYRKLRSLGLWPRVELEKAMREAQP